MLIVSNEKLELCLYIYIFSETRFVGSKNEWFQFKIIECFIPYSVCSIYNGEIQVQRSIENKQYVLGTGHVNKHIKKSGNLFWFNRSLNEHGSIKDCVNMIRLMLSL